MHQAAIMDAAQPLADVEQKLSTCRQWQVIASGTEEPARQCLISLEQIKISDT